MKERKEHWLTALKADRVPEHMAFLAASTYPLADATRPNTTAHHLRCYYAHYVHLVNGQVEGEDQLGSLIHPLFWDWLENQKTGRSPLWIFCHGGTHTSVVMGLWDMVEKGRIEFYQDDVSSYRRKPGATADPWHGLIVIEESPFALKFRWKGTTRDVYFIDIKNYFRSSLSEIAASLGITLITGLPPDAPFEIYLEKCERDTAVIRGAVYGLLEVIRQEKCGNMAITIASQAFNAFRRSHLTAENNVYVHTAEDVLKAEHAAFYGGLAQPFYLGHVVQAKDAHLFDDQDAPQLPHRTGPVYVLDATAFYPWAMIEHRFPMMFLREYNSWTVENLKVRQPDRVQIAEVKIQTKGNTYPLKWEGRTIYPEGTYWTTLPGPELDAAVKAGDVVQVGRVWEYKSCPLFRSFVIQFWSLRKKYRDTNRRAEELCIKLLMNSLYGKFAQRSHDWELAPDVDAPYPLGYFYRPHPVTGKQTQYRSIGGEVQMEQPPDEGPESFPGISAFVTSYARVKLKEWIATAGPENVYYVDTDCLHVNGKAYGRLTRAGQIVPGELGMLSLRAKVQTAEYRNIKNYTLDGVDVIAGLQRDATKTAAGTWEVSHWHTLAEMIQRQTYGTISVERKEFDMLEEPHWGRVAPNGRVHPPVLSLDYKPADLIPAGGRDDDD